jgi:hypothetical protein
VAGLLGNRAWVRRNNDLPPMQVLKKEMMRPRERRVGCSIPHPIDRSVSLVHNPIHVRMEIWPLPTHRVLLISSFVVISFFLQSTVIVVECQVYSPRSTTTWSSTKTHTFPAKPDITLWTAYYHIFPLFFCVYTYTRSLAYCSPPTIPPWGSVITYGTRW